MQIQPADSLAAARPETTASVRQLLPEDAPAVGIERTMLQQDKLYVVAAVVLLIWLGVAAFLFATDRRLDRLERDLARRDAP